MWLLYAACDVYLAARGSDSVTASRQPEPAEPISENMELLARYADHHLPVRAEVCPERKEDLM